MKKYLLSALILAASLEITAQETTVSDALRYSISDLNGTARFRGLSGAFGAVGGDLSAINVNPAGSSIFNYNSATGTISNFNTKNNSSYFGTNTSDNESAFDINQIGGVLVFGDKQGKSNWKKIAVAINYENTNNFDNNFYVRGTNPNSSISNYFLNFANTGNNGGIIPIDLVELQPGESISELYTYLASFSNGFAAQQAFLGYQAFLYDYNDGVTPDPDVPDNAPYYMSNVPGGSFYQENRTSTTGYNSKLTGNISAEYNEKLHIGLNLNAHFTDYRVNSVVYERNSNNPALGVQQIQFENEIYTYGGGFSFNLGAILKVSKEFRIGAAYESPTWYHLNDELTQGLVATSHDGSNTFTDAVYPQVTNVYEPYNIQTPGKLTGSLAYIFGKNGFISFDYGRKDYSQTKFRPQNSDTFNALNSEISNSLTAANEFRIGAEYKIKQISLRGGYRFEESPYKDKQKFDDLKGYSAGLGFNFKGSRLDLAYSYAERDSQMRLISSGMNDTAKVTTKNNNVSLSYTIDF
ncbi:outer membrane protein transport protein [Flavobacterium enshiense]|uniref:OmpP1/FadL family transporter n=1 Tax=Flavobacterium enshiense TaxID=1341165 RepID=UPI00345CB72D